MTEDEALVRLVEALETIGHSLQRVAEAQHRIADAQHRLVMLDEQDLKGREQLRHILVAEVTAFSEYLASKDEGPK